MEILKRAKGFQSGEGVSYLESESNVREEAIRRGYKAGYTNREGGPLATGRIMSQGIGESTLNVWPRDENGNLIDD